MLNKRKSTWWCWSVVLPAAVLLGIIAVQGLPLMRKAPPLRHPQLAVRVPLAPEGWTGRDVPLGPSEFMSNEAEKVLNYDEVVNREYRRGRDTFGVYAAYWRPGKMPIQLVASHTPDRCWTENGWHCLEMKFRQTGLFAGAGLPPAEWRLFEPPLGGQPTYVLYWHLVDGQVYDYGRRFNAVPDPFLWWQGALQQVLLGNREQLFIRLTASVPLESLGDDPGFRQVLAGLRTLGLGNPAAATSLSTAQP